MTIEEIIAALQAIIDGSEGRSLNDDEVQRYEDLEGQLQTAQRDQQIRQRNAAYNMPVAGTPGLAAAVHVGTAKEDDTLERAFNHYLRTGRENADMVQLRAQSEGTPSEGGYLVPDGFRQKLVDRMKAFGGIAGVVEEITTATGNNLPWVTVDDTGNTGEIVSEGGTFAAGADLVFGTADLGAYSYMAGGGSATPLRVSLELLQDATFDVEGLVSNKLGERIARIQSTHLVSGTGSSQPQGITDGLTGIEPAATGSSCTYADLLEWVHSVDPAYRENGRWAFNDNSLQMIRGLVDDNGRPLLKGADDGVAGGPGGETLLGYPVQIDQAFPDYLGTAGAGQNWGVFGDLKEGYVVRRVRAVEILVNPYSRMANRQVEFTAWARMDAVQQNTHSYIAMAGFTA